MHAKVHLNPATALLCAHHTFKIKIWQHCRKVSTSLASCAFQAQSLREAVEDFTCSLLAACIGYESQVWTALAAWDIVALLMVQVAVLHCWVIWLAEHVSPD